MAITISVDPHPSLRVPAGDPLINLWEADVYRQLVFAKYRIFVIRVILPVF